MQNGFGGHRKGCNFIMEQENLELILGALDSLGVRDFLSRADGQNY